MPPIYEYQCPKCKKLRDELRSLSEEINFSRNPCLSCNEPMIKIMSATAGYVKGTDTPTKIKK